MSADPYRSGPIDWRAKGWPDLDEGVTPAALASLGWDALGGRLSMPVMLLRESALAHDLASMAGWARGRGVRLAPHGKTTMAPAIWRRQLEAGAWAITLATPWQARVAARCGVPRILIANEVVDEEGIDWLARTLRQGRTEVLCYVDSPAGVDRLASGLEGRLGGGPGATGVRLPVLLEVGLAGTRTGCRSVGEALDVARRAAPSPHLRLAGVAFFEGIVAGSDRDERLAAVRELTRLAREVALAIDDLVRADGGGEIILSGGGSTYPDVVVEELTRPLGASLPVAVVLRSGSSVVHDHGAYEAESPFGAAADLAARNADVPEPHPGHEGPRSPGDPGAPPRLRPALEIWAPVLSLPEPGLAIVMAGRRDLPYDAGLPRVVRMRGSDGLVRTIPDGWLTVSRLNDQHAYLEVTDVAPGAGEMDAGGVDARSAPPRLEVGDLVGMGISHPCSAFDRWRWLPLVDDDYRILDAYELLF